MKTVDVNTNTRWKLIRILHNYVEKRNRNISSPVSLKYFLLYKKRTKNLQAHAKNGRNVRRENYTKRSHEILLFQRGDIIVKSFDSRLKILVHLRRLKNY